MRNISILVAALVIGAFGAASANDQTRESVVDSPRAISAEQMKIKIDRLGYDLDRMKQHDGFYNTQLTDRESGEGLDVVFDAKTGEVARARLASDDHKAERREEGHDRKKARAHKADDKHRDNDHENRD